MKVLGISPLDKDATASVVEDGRILFASAEERYSRQKQHAGFPRLAIAEALGRTGTDPSEIDALSMGRTALQRATEGEPNVGPENLEVCVLERARVGRKFRRLPTDVVSELLGT